MKAQELNLCELLKGCEGMVFYSTMVGYCRLIEVTEFITIGYGDDEYVFLPSKPASTTSAFLKPCSKANFINSKVSS